MKNSTFSRLISLCMNYIKDIVIAILSSLVSVPLALFGPIFIGRAIDVILGEGLVNFEVVKKNIGLLILTIAISSLLQWVMQVSTRKVSANVARDMRQSAFEKINSAPISRIDNSSQGDLVSRLVNDADAVSEGVLQALTQLIPGIVTIIATIVLMFSLNWVIALVVVILTPISVFFAKFVSNRTGHNFKKQSIAQGELSSIVNETVSNQNLMRAFCAEEKMQEQFEASSEAFRDANFKATFYSSVVNPGTRFVNAIVYGVVGVCGILFVINGEITIGGVSVFLSYANQYTKPFNEVSAVLTQIQAAFAGATRLFECIDFESEPKDLEKAHIIKEAKGKVDIYNMDFSYDKNVKLIQDFELHAKPGMKIALVGPTGCGKTTIINLLMRFYEIDVGEICVDDENIENITRNSLRTTYGMVLQDSWLKEATVAENIAYARTNASREEVIEAAKSAYAHNFILKLPKGYDTVLKNNAENLSEGQRQLLCIARIILSKPQMLILDEATSNIDTRTEMLIQQALTKLMQGHTSFIVAHRLSTIENADLILVMKDGKIIEKGTHTELLKENGFYNNLYNSQFVYK